jgi:hypothetical protein
MLKIKTMLVASNLIYIISLFSREQTFVKVIDIIGLTLNSLTYINIHKSR